MILTSGYHLGSLRSMLHNTAAANAFPFSRESLVRCKQAQLLAQIPQLLSPSNITGGLVQELHVPGGCITPGRNHQAAAWKLGE